MNNIHAATGADPGPGQNMYDLIKELYPICRSITGDGLRKSLGRIQEIVPLTLHEIPTGTPVFDWEIPREWNIQDAYLLDPHGNKIVDFQKSNLHIVNYSIPMRQRFTLAELKPHLHTLPSWPDRIPYRTSYYKENWGFCLRHSTYQDLPAGEYEVFIDTTLEPGHLTYGEYFLPGKIDEEILISCHCCHPSLCNDNLSGMALATYLAAHLSSRSNRYSYRFLFIPGTIGAITWLALNEDRIGKIKHGLVVACVGDGGGFTYKRSRQGNAEIDRAASQVLKSLGQPYEILNFTPYGYDERQYGSPGINLAVGSLTRTPHGRYPEYHTSADNLDLVQPQYLAGSLETYLQVIDSLEGNASYRNTHPKGEPQLGRRGLYDSFGGRQDSNEVELALLWVLNYSDGDHDLLEIAGLSGLGFPLIRQAASLLKEKELLQ